jgi:multidrug efflux pump subunit AcrB
LQPGSRLEDTAAIADQARRITSKLPEVTSVFSSIGMASGAGGPVSSGGYPDVRKATLTVTLVSRHDRAPQKVIEAEIRKRLSVLPGVRWSVGAGQAGEVLKIVLAGEDAGALEVASQKATAELRSLPGIGNVTSGASLQRPEIHIIPDYAKAADLGVTAGSIASLIRVATSGDFNAQLPKLNLPQRQVPIRVRLSPELRYHLDAIKALRVPTNQGSVPLSSIAKVQMGSGPAQINRFDRERNVTIDVQLGGSELGEVLKEANKLPALQSLPPGIHRLNSGDVERMKELFGSFGTAMMIGILCIYVVLVLLFHDFLQPVTILAALPLSVGGAFIALLATHHSFSMPAVIGLLMLMGIVTKNSILLVEYAVKARRNLGMSRHDAILDACRKRARPILMTTIAMVAGMIPIALGLGAEPSFRSPMAIAVIGGLLTSTLLSLLVIPVVFTYVDDLLNLLQRGIRRFTANEKTV